MYVHYTLPESVCQIGLAANSFLRSIRACALRHQHAEKDQHFWQFDKVFPGMGGSAGKNLLLEEADRDLVALSVVHFGIQRSLPAQVRDGRSDRDGHSERAGWRRPLRESPFLVLDKNNHDMVLYQLPNHNITVILSSPC